MNSEFNEMTSGVQEMKSSEKLWKDQKIQRDVGKPLNYAEALMHILKGNIGTGCFAENSITLS